MAKMTMIAKIIRDIGAIAEKGNGSTTILQGVVVLN